MAIASRNCLRIVTNVSHTTQPQTVAESYTAPGPSRLGRWAVAALAASIGLHVYAFFALEDVQIALGFREARELRTAPVRAERVEIMPMDVETPRDTTPTPPTDTAPLLEEIDILDKMPKNQEIDMKPSADQATFAANLKAPSLQAGDPKGQVDNAIAGLTIESDLPELGKSKQAYPPAVDGQLTVDPGAAAADTFDNQKFVDDALKKGAHGKAQNGALEGVVSLDDMIGLNAKALVGSTTMLPSDLLFEYNSAQLRENAKVGLMKLALLIDKNPELYCWIEGHTDLIGGDEFNQTLSVRRADAVKNYLVQSMGIPAKRIATRGFGKRQPIVMTGAADQQSPNRRVEIKMRKTLPAADPAPAPPPAKPVDPSVQDTVHEEPAPRAKPIEPKPEPVKPPQAKPQPPAPPRAKPVQPEEAAPRAVPRAEPVVEPAEPTAPRAQRVEEEPQPAVPVPVPEEEP